MEWPHDFIRRNLAERSSAGEPAPPSAFIEYGSTTQWPALPEYVPELRTRYLALRMYEKMIRNDAQVRVTVRATKIPVLGGEWFVKPASDDPRDLEIAEFVWYNFNYMSISFIQLLEEVLRMLEFGHSVLEPVYKLGDWTPGRDGAKTRQFTMWEKFAPRPQHTIRKFLYDFKGGPAGIEQTVYDGVNQRALPEPVTIPIDKLVIFTFDKMGGNVEGNSILRTAYKHWYYKENLYKIDAIQKERHGIGIPDIALPPGYTEDDKKFAAEMAGNLRTNEKAFILRPPGWEVGFAEIDKSNMVDVLKSAEHHDLLIARNVLVQFINMGAGSQASSGSRATAGTMADLFTKSLRQLAHNVAAMFNLYCVRKLVDYNYNNVVRYPELDVRQIGETRDLQMFASALHNLQAAGLITGDKETEDWIRTQLDMPEKLGSRPKGADEANFGISNSPFPQQNGGKEGRPNTGRTGRPDNAAQ